MKNSTEQIICAIQYLLKDSVVQCLTADNGKFMIKRDGNSHYFYDFTNDNKVIDFHGRSRLMDDLAMGELRNQPEKVLNLIDSLKWGATAEPENIGRFIQDTLGENRVGERFNSENTACIEIEEIKDDVISFVFTTWDNNDIQAKNKSVKLMMEHNWATKLDVVGFNNYEDALILMKSMDWN